LPSAIAQYCRHQYRNPPARIQSRVATRQLPATPINFGTEFGIGPREAFLACERVSAPELDVPLAQIFDGDDCVVHDEECERKKCENRKVTIEDASRSQRTHRLILRSPLNTGTTTEMVGRFIHDLAIDDIQALRRETEPPISKVEPRNILPEAKIIPGNALLRRYLSPA
jgi:hypothetical protein